MKRFLITGANGQIGTELMEQLCTTYGRENVVCMDLVSPQMQGTEKLPVFEILDATNMRDVERLVQKYEIDTVFHLVSILSAKGEKDPDLAWRVNLESLKIILDLAKSYHLAVFWPSSIAVFGPSTPKENTPQKTPLDPNSMYGITKVAGELLCNYYFEKYGVDVRSLRFPGIISYKTPPGGGTTDYAVEIFYEAIRKNSYTCFLRSDTTLPMMYMDDAVSAIMKIMQADPARISIRTSYNLAAFSFSPAQIAAEINKHIPDFRSKYAPDYRQTIADSWPKTIDDSQARKDWGWRHQYDLAKMTEVMLKNLRPRLV